VDLELLHNFTKETYATFANESSVLRNFFRTSVVHMGLRNAYVMRAVLALSALHLAHVRGDDVYRARATARCWVASHTAVGLMTANTITSEMALSLFIFSTLMTFYGMYIRPISRNHGPCSESIELTSSIFSASFIVVTFY
jgi:hypothetical protein